MEYGTRFELNPGNVRGFEGFIFAKSSTCHFKVVRSRRGHLGLVMEVVDKVYVRHLSMC
jgi:hypothetical protein